MKKVMVFGTFDLLHKGHLYFLNEAKKYGDLTVVVAKDSTVEKVKNKKPLHDAGQRKEAIEKTGIAKKVIIGNDGISFQCIIDEKPDIICLGYDQNSRDVEKMFPNIEYILIDSHEPHIYKSSKIKAGLQ